MQWPEEVVSMLSPYPVRLRLTAWLRVVCKRKPKWRVRTLLARIQQPDGKMVEVRSPLPGRINKILKTNGAQVAQ